MTDLQILCKNVKFIKRSYPFRNVGQIWTISRTVTISLLCITQRAEETCIIYNTATLMLIYPDK